MTLILDNITIPEQGLLEVKLNLTVEIKVTAEQARKKVDHWLMDQVSLLMGAEPPALVAGTRVVWRVPVFITFPHVGKAGIAGVIDVNVETGEMNNTPERKAEIERCAAQIAQRQPPFKLMEVSEEYKAKNLPPAPPPRYITFESQNEAAAPDK